MVHQIWQSTTGKRSIIANYNYILWHVRRLHKGWERESQVPRHNLQWSRVWTWWQMMRSAVWWCSRSSHFTAKWGDILGVFTRGKSVCKCWRICFPAVINFRKPKVKIYCVFQPSLAPCYSQSMYLCVLKVVMGQQWSNFNLLHGQCMLLFPYVIMCSGAALHDCWIRLIVYVYVLCIYYRNGYC